MNQYGQKSGSLNSKFMQPNLKDYAPLIFLSSFMYINPWYYPVQ
jgi:hypothetical protein